MYASQFLWLACDYGDYEVNNNVLQNENESRYAFVSVVPHKEYPIK